MIKLIKNINRFLNKFCKNFNVNYDALYGVRITCSQCHCSVDDLHILGLCTCLPFAPLHRWHFFPRYRKQAVQLGKKKVYAPKNKRILTNHQCIDAGRLVTGESVNQLLLLRIVSVLFVGRDFSIPTKKKEKAQTEVLSLHDIVYLRWVHPFCSFVFLFLFQRRFLTDMKNQIVKSKSRISRCFFVIILGR